MYIILKSSEYSNRKRKEIEKINGLALMGYGEIAGRHS